MSDLFKARSSNWLCINRKKKKKKELTLTNKLFWIFMARMDGESVERKEQKLTYLKWLDAFLDDRYPQKHTHSKIITRNKTLIVQQQSTGNVAAGKIPETESERKNKENRKF